MHIEMKPNATRARFLYGLKRYETCHEETKLFQLKTVSVKKTTWIDKLEKHTMYNYGLAVA